jgi:hypothetical protein
MPIRHFTFLVLAAMLALPVSASAGWMNELGRHTGLGWSDGYHAYEGCPDSRHRSQPWQRRANRSGGYDEPLVPYLEPPELAPKTSRNQPGASSAARTSKLHISRPNY